MITIGVTLLPEVELPDGRHVRFERSGELTGENAETGVDSVGHVFTVVCEATENGGPGET